MAKLLMVSTNLMDDPYPVYPLGADLVASAAREAGHEVRLVDMMVDGESGLDAAIGEFRPGIIAFSMRNVDNVNFNEPQSFVGQYRAVINRIRQKTGAPIILGGTAFTIFPGMFLDFLGADYGVTGPGEVSLPKLMAALEKGEKPPARVIAGETDATGANSYFLSRDGRLADYYLRQGGMLNLFTKRGCPHKCLYCSYPSLEGDRYIYRNPPGIVDEIEYLVREHSADFIFFTDSVFNDAGGRYLLIMEEMARRGVKVPWTCYMRPARFSKDEVELMKRTGLHSVEWGTDCSSDRTLKGMGKDFSWDDVRQANNLFAGLQVPGSHFIIFGGPGETPDSVREGVQNLSELEGCVVFGGMGVRVFPGTGICELAKKEGRIRDESGLFREEYYYFSSDIETEWLHEFLLESFKTHRTWAYPWAGFADRNRFLHSSGMRGPLWDLLLKPRRSR